MHSIVTSVVPLFSVIFLGYAAGKFGLINTTGVRAMVTFVFSFAMPALIFRMMAVADIAGTGDWPVVLAYFGAQLPIFLAGLLIGGWLFRQSLAEMTIQAFGSSFSNSVVLGLPLVLSLYGERAGVPALLIITLDIAIFGAITVLLEIASLRASPSPAKHPLFMLRDLGRSVFMNPLILSSVLGILFGLSPLALPATIENTLAFLGQAGPPAGLFALGATLGLRAIGGQAGPVAAMMTLKLVLHPLLLWAVVAFLVDLDPVAAHVALLFAACPVGANVYVFAAHYAAAVETSATAILLSTALALITLSFLAWTLTGGTM